MKQSRQENIIYLIVWSLLFVAPLLSLYVRSVSDPSITFEWTKAFVVWPKFAIYLVLFLVHNFLLAPLLIHRHRRAAYFSIVAVIIAAFSLYQCNSRPPVEKPMGDRPPMERAERLRVDDGTPGMMPRPPHDERLMPPPFIGERDIMAIVLIILILGANLGIKYYFKTRDDRKRLAELERQNLEQQLEYLRYQINPHFFMNTLNNIHALVDIDPEKAKYTILELSKMMRFVLYEGNKQGVPLSREMDFIRHYVTLMQLRYTDKVRITLDLPSEVPDRQIPPLILITFIENAFKHGVSYQHDSFIEAKVVVEGDKLRFLCRNSKSEKSNEERLQVGGGSAGTKGGVGLDNVRKRLNLLYDNRYSLNIKDEANTYCVQLNIPL
ncbi:MAG: histidine kinase [Bacteroidaceae bacterium]|nr:histidine kinase [Bacteroidaceae bacterium]